jgi:GrpB-like predicted nucleotidyltransferase (UPF0157 family)
LLAPVNSRLHSPPMPSFHETLEERIERVLRDEFAIVPYDPRWPELFLEEKAHLLSCLPSELVRRIEHFGSTAVAGLAAKPVVDMLVEVTDLNATRTRIVPILEEQEYDFFWRPSHDDGQPPFYAWFIKRDATGVRTHHIHMIESDFTEHWDAMLFRDFLIEFPHVAREYETLQLRLAAACPGDRVAYTKGKTEFVVDLTARAKRHYGGG